MFPLSVIWNVNPEIFHAGMLSVRWYSLLFAAAFVAGYLIMKKIFRQENIPLKTLHHLTWYMVLGTLIGARLGHCFFYEPGYYLQHPAEIPQIWRGGLASHGAAIGILIALYIFSKADHYPYLWIVDRIVIVVALSGFFIRMGNLMNSEIYGTETTLPWGFVFVRAYEVIPKHPTQIYEALSYLIIFIILCRLYIYTDVKRFPGTLFGTFLVSVFSVRFLIEFVKENQVAFEKSIPLNMGQILSIPFILLGIYLLLRSPGISHSSSQGNAQIA